MQPSPRTRSLTSATSGNYRRKHHRQSYKSYRAQMSEIHEDLPMGPELYDHMPAPQVRSYNHGIPEGNHDQAETTAVADQPHLVASNQTAPPSDQLNGQSNDQPKNQSIHIDEADDDEDEDMEMCSTAMMVNVPDSPDMDMTSNQHVNNTSSHFLESGHNLKAPDKNPGPAPSL